MRPASRVYDQEIMGNVRSAVAGLALIGCGSITAGDGLGLDGGGDSQSPGARKIGAGAGDDGSTGSPSSGGSMRDGGQPGETGGAPMVSSGGTSAGGTGGAGSAPDGGIEQTGGHVDSGIGDGGAVATGGTAGGGGAGGTATGGNITSSGGAATGGAATGGVAGAGGVVSSGGAGGSASCQVGEKLCGGVCHSPGPEVGCGLTGCTGCGAAPNNSVRTCEGTQCSFDCDPGYILTADGLGCEVDPGPDFEDPPSNACSVSPCDYKGQINVCACRVTMLLCNASRTQPGGPCWSFTIAESNGGFDEGESQLCQLGFSADCAELDAEINDYCCAGY